MFDAFVIPGIPRGVFWVFVGLAIVLQGISKSGFAGGVGILSLPLMMLVMPVAKVTAVLLPLLILCDINAVYHHRRNADWKLVRVVYVPAVVGIVLGAAVWWYVGRERVDSYGVTIKRFVGVVSIVFALYIGAKDRAVGWVAERKGGPIAAWVAGVSAGFASTIAHAAGPIVSLFLFSQELGKTLFVGTVAWTFTLINLTKLPFYIAVGLIRPDVLWFGLTLVWLIPIGSWLGHWLHHRVSERVFNRIVMVLVMVGGIQLVTDTNIILEALTWLRMGTSGEGPG